MVVQDTSLIELYLSQSSDSVFLTLDGQTGVPMQIGDHVRITRAEGNDFLLDCYGGRGNSATSRARGR